MQTANIAHQNGCSSLTYSRTAEAANREGALFVEFGAYLMTMMMMERTYHWTCATCGSDCIYTTYELADVDSYKAYTKPFRYIRTLYLHILDRFCLYIIQNLQIVEGKPYGGNNHNIFDDFICSSAVVCVIIYEYVFLTRIR